VLDVTRGDLAKLVIYFGWRFFGCASLSYTSTPGRVKKLSTHNSSGFRQKSTNGGFAKLAPWSSKNSTLLTLQHVAQEC
jgi:hypothetical protein